MGNFIAYFDYLGFKDFIEKNDSAYQHKIIGNIFQDIESAIGQGKHIQTNYGYINDISKSKINSINFSDTVIFWTNDDSEESLNELLAVSHTFNWQAIDYFFPVRGAVVHGDIFHVDYSQPNGAGGKYVINSVYGKGLVQAHLKAESQNWAGTVIDNSIIELLSNRGKDINTILSPFAKKYKVPYKPCVVVNEEEFAYWIVKGLSGNETAFNNMKEKIKKNFAAHNKDVNNPGAKEKLDNTIKFLKSFL